MPSDLDYTDIGAYLISLSKRIASLEVDSSELAHEMHEKYENMQKTNKELKVDLLKMKTEASDLRRETAEIASLIALLVKEFNTITRKSEMDRLNRKIDDWSPERLATHRDLFREIEKVKKQHLSKIL